MRLPCHVLERSASLGWVGVRVLGGPTNQKSDL